MENTLIVMEKSWNLIIKFNNESCNSVYYLCDVLWYLTGLHFLFQTLYRSAVL